MASKIEDAINSLNPEELDLLNSDPKMLSDFKAKYSSSSPLSTGLFGSSIGKNTKGMAIARIPQAILSGVSKGMMDAIEPTTQSVPINAALRIPQTLASIGTEIQSSNVSPESFITQGVLKGAQLASPLIKAGGRLVGKAAEAFSGLGYKTPGVLAETVADPLLPFGKGLDTAREVYKGVADTGAIRESMKMATSREELLGHALDAVKNKDITADEALEARKVVDSMKKKLPDVSFHTLRDIFDSVAKEKFDRADKLFSRAIKSEALRQFFPINKGGTPSIFKVGIGGATIPRIIPFSSPLVQGLGASAIGATGKLVAPLVDNPALGMGIPPLFKRYRDENQ